MKIEAKTCYEGIFPIYQQVHGAQYLWKVICDIANRILGRKVDDPDYLRDFTYGIITILPGVGTIFNLFLYIVMYRNIAVDAPKDTYEKIEYSVTDEPDAPSDDQNDTKADPNRVIRSPVDPQEALPKITVTPAVASATEDKPTPLPPPVATGEFKKPTRYNFARFLPGGVGKKAPKQQIKADPTADVIK